MHQLLSAILSFFLSPFNWMLLFLAFAFFSKKKNLKKSAFAGAVAIFFVFGNSWLLDEYAKMWQPKPVVIPEGVSYSCGLVPGGFASADSHAEGYFNSASDRFIQAVRLFKTGRIRHILISGGNSKQNEMSFREAAWAKAELMAVGIPDSVIITEDRSNHTEDNAHNTKQLLDSLSVTPPYLLITSASHMRRATLLYEKAGLAVTPFPCNYTNGRGSFSLWNLLPGPSTLLGWNTYLKETLGYWVYKLRK